MRFVTLFLVFLIIATLVTSIEGGKKKRKRKKKKVEWKEPEVANLWDDGGYLFEAEGRISDPRDPLSDMMRLYTSSEAYLKREFEYLVANTDDSRMGTIHPPGFQSTLPDGILIPDVMEILGDSGLGYVHVTIDPTLPITVFVGYVDTRNGTDIPEYMGQICQLQTCMDQQSIPDIPSLDPFGQIEGNELKVTVKELVEKRTPSSMAIIQDNFISMAERLIAIGDDLGDVLCVTVDPIHATLMKEVAAAEDKLASFKGNPKSSSGYHTDILIPELHESMSARILLRLLEKLCKKPVPKGSVYTW